MQAYSFVTVPRIISNLGASNMLGEQIGQHFGTERRILIVTDPGFIGTGQVGPIVEDLQDCGHVVSIYSEVQADPPEAIVLAAADRTRSEGIDLVVGLGGGSSMDVAKLIAVLAHGEQSLASMYGIEKVMGSRLPLVQIPTTAGTGSEVTPIAIVTTGEQTKMGVVADTLYADLVILDANLTLGLPAHVTAATGIDAMVHAIEAYTSKHKKNPISDMLARQALKLLHANLLTACREPKNVEARQAMLLGAMFAGQAFANAPVAAVHALAYPIGGVFHVPHGLSNSLVLPHVLRFNAPIAETLYAELSTLLFPEMGGDTASKCANFITEMEKLAHATGIASHLRDVGIAEKDLALLTDQAMLQTRLLRNNPRELTHADIHQIYSAAL